MGIFDNLPDFDLSRVGELSAPIPSLPIPSISDIGEIGSLELPELPDLGLPGLPGLPSDFLPDMPNLPSISEIGEISAPFPNMTTDDPGVRAAGMREAERGLDARDEGRNVVGIAEDDGIFGEDGPIFSQLAGVESAQRFARLHDVQAAMAEPEDGGGLGFTLANAITAGVGSLGTMATQSPEAGAEMANTTFHLLGFQTGDFAGVQREAARQHLA